MHNKSETSLIKFGDEVLVGGNTAYDWQPLDTQYLDIFRAFLIDSQEQVSFYRNRFKQQKIDLSSIKSFEDIQQIPLLTVNDVSIERAPETTLLSDRHAELLVKGFSSLELPERIAKRFFTTGSSGVGKKVSYYTYEDWDVLTADSVRQVRHIPTETSSRALHLFKVPQSVFFSDTFSRRGACVEFSNIANLSEDDVLNQISNSFTDVNGLDCLLVPPCLPPGVTIKKGFTLDSLLDADHNQTIIENIKTFFTAGAPRDLPHYRIKERVWEGNEKQNVAKAKFIDVYGCTEIGTAAAECEYNDGHHLCQGRVYTEVINPNTGQHVKNGEQGLIVQTSLRKGSRYIRYVVGDEATFISEACRCGRSSARLKNIERISVANYHPKIAKE